MEVEEEKRRKEDVERANGLSQNKHLRNYAKEAFGKRPRGQTVGQMGENRPGENTFVPLKSIPRPLSKSIRVG